MIVDCVRRECRRSGSVRPLRHRVPVQPGSPGEAEPLDRTGSGPRRGSVVGVSSQPDPSAGEIPTTRPDVVIVAREWRGHTPADRRKR